MQRLASMFRFAKSQHSCDEDDEIRRMSKVSKTSSKASSSSSKARSSYSTFDDYVQQHLLIDGEGLFEDNTVDHGEQYVLQSHFKMLLAVMETRDGRSMLANLLIRFKSDYCLKMRFCHVVEKFQQLERTSRQRRMIRDKGRYIVNTFVVDGSMFVCQDIPLACKHALIKQLGDNFAMFPELIELKDHFLCELAEQEEVQHAISKVYSKLFSMKE